MVAGTGVPAAAGVIICLGLPLPAASSGSDGGTGKLANRCPGAEALALLPAGVYRAGTSRCRWCALTAPLHPCLCPWGHRRCVSVALSSRSPALGVTQQAWPLGSPDFPQPGGILAVAWPRPWAVAGAPRIAITSPAFQMESYGFEVEPPGTAP